MLCASSRTVKANRILMRDMRVIEEKSEQKQANERKIEALRRGAQ
jgi:CCR4-NOT transcriptional regulation complex NOT5 subunit